MMHPQDIREKTFEKAVFGGYDMAAVDNFLSAVAEELESAQKESSVLKSKMKVLVEKIEEYRANEDAMRMALVSAQKISTQIQSEAEQKGAEILEAAQKKSDEIVGAMREQRSLEEARLVEAKRQSAEFIERMRLICGRQMDFLDAIGEAEPVLAQTPAASRPQTPAPVQEKTAPEPEPDSDEDTFRSIEDSVARLVDMPREPETEVGGFESDDSAKTKHFTPVSEASTAARPRFSFEDLRFGDN